MGDPEPYTEVRLSPDGRLAAVGILMGQSNEPDIWLWDLPRGVKTRFTFDGSRKCCFSWAPGGERIAWAGSVPGGRADIYLGSVLGMDTPAVLWQDELLKFPSSWTPDGRQLLYSAHDGSSPWNLWRLPVAEGGAPGRMWESAFQHVFPSVSPDGRWLAYSSDESGRWEVYVTDFPESRRKWQVSVEGGVFPLWRRDGRELAFAEVRGSLAVAEVDGSGETFVVGEVETLFGELPVLEGHLLHYMTGDGERFLILAPVTGPEGEDLPPMTLVVNWTSELRKR